MQHSANTLDEAHRKLLAIVAEKKIPQTRWEFADFLYLLYVRANRPDDAPAALGLTITPSGNYFHGDILPDMEHFRAFARTVGASKAEILIGEQSVKTFNRAAAADVFIQQSIKNDDFPQRRLDFGKLLQAFRERSGLTYAELEESTGIAATQMKRYVSEGIVPGRRDLRAYLKATGATPDERDWMLRARAQLPEKELNPAAWYKTHPSRVRPKSDREVG